MPTTPNAILDGYKIYRANFLPGFSRPLVFIAWGEYKTIGFTMLQVDYVIAHPVGPAQAEAVTIDKRYLSRTQDFSAAVQTLSEIALDRAEDALEKLVGQGVILEEISTEKFLVCAHREGWTSRWKEILDLTQYDSLRTLLYDLESSQLHRLAKFVAVNPSKS